MSLTQTNSRMISNVGTGANQLVQLDANAKLPAVDGSQLTNLSGSDPCYFKFALAGSTNIGTGFPQDDKLNFSTETFKSTGFASWDTSNLRLVPNTAGYYYINAQIRGNSSANFSRFYVQIRKNGTDVATGDTYHENLDTASTSSLIYFNGTSDYVDVVVAHNHSSTVGIATSNSNTFLQGFKI